MFVKVNVWTLGQAYKLHGKEIKNEKPKTGEFGPFWKITFGVYTIDEKWMWLVYSNLKNYKHLHESSSLVTISH